ncbi:hypothetical protein CSB20_10600 [bacterium DOLZORAL124_64_63]|nr:MAG: hypothetical protein CSB20_10600 [bacterium DOLZORAL124_64_63]
MIRAGEVAVKEIGNIPTGKTTLWPARHALIVAGAAILLRGVLYLQARDSAFLHTPVVDASFFDLWARSLVEGRVFQDQAFFKPPFYAYLLSFLYRLGLGMTAVLMLQLLVGTGTALLTLAVGRLTFAPRVALTGALICALLPILPFFEIQLLAESWTTALTMGGLLLTLLSVRGKSRTGGKSRNTDGPQPRLWQPGGAGLLLGLAALGRPNLLPAILVMALWVFWKTRQDAGKPTAAILLLAGCAAGMAPATIHNLGYGQPVLISANLGANLVAGNSDQADGMSAIPVGVRWDDLQLRTRQAGHTTPTAASRYLTREALDWMVDHPGRVLQLLGKKVLLFCGGEEPRNNINPRWLAEKEGVWLLARWWPATWLMLPLAVVGLILARGRADGGATLLRGYLLAQFLAVLPFFVNARFRAPLLPVLALFAAAAAWELAGRVRRKNGLAAPLLLLIPFLVLANGDWLGLRQEKWLARDHFNLALIHSRGYNGRTPQPDLAEEQFRQAARLMPADPDFQERLAAHLLTQVPALMNQASRLDAAGNIPGMRQTFRRIDTLLDEAIRRHQMAASSFPRSYRSFANLGTAWIWRADILTHQATLAGRRGDETVEKQQAGRALHGYQQALQALRQSLDIHPRQPEIRQQIQVVAQSVLRLPPVSREIEQAQQQIRNPR